MIEAIDEEVGYATCAWLAGGGVKRFTFRLDQLEPIGDDDPLADSGLGHLE